MPTPQTASPCTHKATIYRGGIISCHDCGKVLSFRKCPDCQEEGVAIPNTNSRATCTKCNCTYAVSGEVFCPKCHNGNRVKDRVITYLKDEVSRNYYCYGCKSSFNKKEPREHRTTVQFPVVTGTARVAGGTTRATSTYTVANKGVKGNCAKCGTPVTVYTKAGGWCKECQAMVFPHARKTHPFFFEGTI